MKFDVRTAASAAAPFPLSEVPSLGRNRKKLRWAYFRWLVLGSHYLYLRRPLTQLLFWVTFGGLLLWWLIDLARLPSMVWKHNDRALSKLLGTYHDALADRLEEARRLEARATADRNKASLAAGPSWAPPTAVSNIRSPRIGFEARPAAMLLLSAALSTAAALYFVNPPLLFPGAA